MRFIPGMKCWFSNQKPSSVIINRLKKKNHTIIPIDGEKTLDKIQHLFFIKTQATRKREELFQLDKGHLQKTYN